MSPLPLAKNIQHELIWFLLLRRLVTFVQSIVSCSWRLAASRAEDGGACIGRLVERGLRQLHNKFDDHALLLPATPSQLTLTVPLANANLLRCGETSVAQTGVRCSRRAAPGFPRLRQRPTQA